MLTLYTMDILTAIILGLVEGFTEFIPVSSSGHLILARDLLGIETGGLAFDAVLQLSAALAVFVYFWKDILGILKTVWGMLTFGNIDSKNRVTIWAIVVGTIPAVILGLLLENFMETVFRNKDLVAIMLILGSFMFYFADRIKVVQSELTIKKGFFLGLFQSLALIPGVSRSGATISGGLFLGLSREDAVRFSFLLSLPVILGAGLKKLLDINLNDIGLGVLMVGSLVSFFSALLAIGFLIRYLRNHNFNIFIVYRVTLAIVILLM